MLMRLLLLIGFCIIFYMVYQLMIAWQKGKATRQANLDSLLVDLDLRIPTLVYFTSPLCAVCKTTQKPALARLHNKITVNVIEVDTMQTPEHAERWGVMCVPTIFVIDANGKSSKVNNGVADERKLFKQIQAIHNIQEAGA